jgi:hypothetical protein
MTAGLAAGSRHGALGPRLFLIEFTGPRKTPSAVLPEEWRVSRFIPKNGPRKTRNHFQTLTLPKPSAPPKPPALFQKMIMSSMILSNPSNSPGAHRDAATSRTPQAPASPKKMILLSMILSNSQRRRYRKEKFSTTDYPDEHGYRETSTGAFTA